MKAQFPPGFIQTMSMMNPQMTADPPVAAQRQKIKNKPPMQKQNYANDVESSTTDGTREKIKTKNFLPKIVPEEQVTQKIKEAAIAIDL